MNNQNLVLKEQLTGIKIYQKKISRQNQNPYLDYLIDSIFQGLNRLLALSFGNDLVWIAYTIFSSKSRNKR